MNSSNDLQQARQSSALDIAQSQILPNGFVNDFLEAPQDYFTMSKDTELMRSLFNINVFLPNLSECSCGNFNRLNNTRREEIENKIISFIEKKYPDKNTHLNLLDFGSGGMFQNFVLMCKLVRAGYKHISYTFVDTIFKQFYNQLQIKIDSAGNISSDYPSFDDFISQPFSTMDLVLDKLKVDIYGGYDDILKKDITLATFIKFLTQIANQNGVTFEMDFKSNISCVSASANKPFHIVTAIDYTDGFDDINEMTGLHRLLQDDEARFFLSIKNFTFVFDRKGCIEKEEYINLLSEYTKLRPILQDIPNTKLSINNHIIQYNQLSNKLVSRMIEWLYILPQVANRNDCKHIHLNFVANPDMKNKISPENLAWFLKLFLPADKTISVNIIYGLQEWMEQSHSFSGLVTVLHASMKDPDQKEMQKIGSKQDNEEKIFQDVLMKLKNNRSGLVIYCNVNIRTEVMEFVEDGCCYSRKSIFNETWKWENGNMHVFSNMNLQHVSASIYKLIFEKSLPVTNFKGTLFNDYQYSAVSVERSSQNNLTKKSG